MTKQNHLAVARRPDRFYPPKDRRRRRQRCLRVEHLEQRMVLDAVTLIDGDTHLRALVPEDDSLGLNWTGIAEPFDDAAWEQSVPGQPNGVGYETGQGYDSFIGVDVEAEMHNRRTSVYVRIPFTVEEGVGFSEFTLGLRYDDGFFAYLNGVPLVGANAPAVLNAGASATENYDDSLSIQFELFDVLADALVSGENILAIHGLNDRPGSSDMLVQAQLFGETFVLGPTAVDDSVQIDQGEQIEIVVLANDDPAPGGAAIDPTTVQIVDPPAAGNFASVNPVTGWITYAPAANYIGQDSFTYRVGDGVQFSNVATVTVRVGTGNLPPVAVDDVYSVDLGTTLVADSPVNVIVPPVASVLIADGSDWRYYDGPDDQGTAWREPGFNDALWNSGPAQLGYGNNGEVTEINDARDPADPQSTLTAYFRREFTVQDASQVVSLAVELVRDDGAAVYLNGVEIVRDNLAPAADYNDGTPVFVGFADERTFFPFAVGANGHAALVDGRNVLAIEVHQNNLTSSDVSFDLRLNAMIAQEAVIAGVLANDSDPDDDPLTMVLVDLPTHGQLSPNSDGTFAYTPETGFSGVDTFAYLANDGAVDSPPATVTIEVIDVNLVPAVGDDQYRVDEDGAISIDAAAGVLANDSDGDGDPISAVLISATSNGSLSLRADGSFDYTPDANFFGVDTFTYRASDGFGDSRDAIVSIAVDPMPDAPVAVDDNYSVDWETTLVADGNDPAGDGLEPPPGAVQWRSEDGGNGHYYLAVVAPGGIDWNSAQAEAVAIGGHLATIATGAENEFVYSLVEDPQYWNGNFSGPWLGGLQPPGSPEPDGNWQWVTEEPFDFTAWWGNEPNNTNGSEDRISYIDNSSGWNDRVVGWSGIIAYVVEWSEGLPQFTSLVPIGSTWSYLDDGSDRGTAWREPDFNDTAWDSGPAQLGYGDSDEATIVNCGPNAPGCNSGNFATTYFRHHFTVDDPASIETLNATVIRDDGVAVYVNGVEVYRDGNLPPDATSNTFTNSPGQDNDLTGFSIDPALLVAGENVIAAEVHQDDPSSSDISFDLALNASVTPGSGSASVLANDIDVDGDALSASVITGPSNGDLDVSPNGSFTYTPDPGFFGPDGFTYVANDGTVDSLPATVTIDVIKVNLLPTAGDDQYDVNEDSAISIDASAGVLANDSDGDGEPITAVLVTPPSHGQFSLHDDGSFDYTPAPDFFGTDTFVYRASDGQGESRDVTVPITVNPRPDAPVAVDDQYVVIAGESLHAALPLSTDPTPRQQTLVPRGSTWSYLDDGSNQGVAWREPNFDDGAWNRGPAQLGYGDGDEATIVTCGPSAPECEQFDDNFITTYFRHGFNVADASLVSEATILLQRDDGAAVYLNGTEVVRDNLNPGAGYLQTANSGVTDENAFHVFAIDPAALVDGMNILAVEVHQINQSTSDMSFDLELIVGVEPATGILGVLANDIDVDGDALRALVVDGPQGGQLDFDADGTFGYTPNAGFHGVDDFTYQAADDGVLSNVATVSITIAEPPVAAADGYDVDEDQSLAIDAAAGVLANDATATPGSMSAVLVDAPASGQLVLESNGSFTFTPEADFSGSVSFTYVARVHVLNSEVTAVTIVVNPIEDAPVAVDDEYASRPSMTLLVAADEGLLSNDRDADGDPLTITLLSQPAVGTLVVETDGALSYEPPLDFLGTVTFDYRIDDGALDSAPAPVTIRVSDLVFDSLVTINEIMYHPASENDAEEYIELYNAAPIPINVAGWQFTSGVSFTLPDVTIASGEFLIVAADVAAFSALYPGVSDVVGSWTGRLSNSSEEIELSDETGNRIDRVTYADEGDFGQRRRDVDGGWTWAATHDGEGSSLELINPAMSNRRGANWAASPIGNPSPGAANTITSDDIAPIIRNVEHLPHIPTSSDPVTIVAELDDEREDGPGSGVVATLFYREATASPGAFLTAEMLDDGASGDGDASDGLYGVVLPAMPDGAVIEFYVHGEDAAGNARAWPAPTDDFGTQGANAPYRVDNAAHDGPQPFFQLVLTDQESRQLGSTNRGTDAQRNATFISVIDGETKVRYNVGVRFRGNGTRRSPPPNYRVNFSSNRTWEGVESVNLNSHYSHSQLLGMSMFGAAGLATQDAAAVQIRRNEFDPAQERLDRTFGSFTWLETLDSDYADNHFPGDSSGNIYRGNNTSGVTAFDYLGENPNSYFNSYGKSTNESAGDWTDIIALARAFDPVQTPDAVFVETIEQVVDVQQWLRFFAVNVLLVNDENGLINGNEDDYAMYRGVVDPRFVLLPHDMDTVLNQGDTTLNLWSRDLLVEVTRNPNMARLILHPNYLPHYYAHLKHLAETVFSAEQLNPMLDELLGGWVAPATIQSMKDFAALRVGFVLDQVAAVPNVPDLSLAQNDLRITEMMFNPDGSDDLEFIEFRNTGSQSINLLGTRFTDGIQFTFPDIELGPGEYAVIVADRDAFDARYGAGVNVAGDYSGRLENSGENVTLVQNRPYVATIADFTYDDAWVPRADGDGFSMLVIDPASDPSGLANAAAWQQSRRVGGSPGFDDATLVMAGDLNRDDRVDLIDLATLRRNLLVGGMVTEADGDLTGDGVVDLSDVAMFVSIFGRMVRSPAVAHAAAAVTQSDDFPSTAVRSRANALQESPRLERTGRADLASRSHSRRRQIIRQYHLAVDHSLEALTEQQPALRHRRAGRMGLESGRLRDDG